MSIQKHSVQDQWETASKQTLRKTLNQGRMLDEISLLNKAH